MPIPDYQSLMLPVLVSSSKGEVRIGSVVEELANQLGLSPEERSELLSSGKQTVFSNRVHWAKTYLSKAQLVEATRRGHFRITARGQTVLQAQPTFNSGKDRSAAQKKAVRQLFLPRMMKNRRPMK